MRRAVSAVIIRDKKLLLFRKGDFWILPGGKPGERELDIETLVREFKEEASGRLIDITGYYGKFTGETPYSHDELEASVYFADLKNPNLDLIPSGEINEIDYFGFPRICGLPLSDITKKVMTKLVKDYYI